MRVNRKKQLAIAGFTEVLNRMNKSKKVGVVLSLIVNLLIASLVFTPQIASAERLKDIASLAGVRSNALVGYGLVVGLDGTGDQTTQTPFTTQSFKSMLKQFGITLPQGISMQLKNVAAVAIHAELPAFAKPGQEIDITVSSIGNAKSLRGGSLLMTPLRGADNEVYALAQGNLVVGGFGAQGSDGSKITVNVPSVGRIPNGATVERSVETAFTQNATLIFNLNRPDFTTSKSIAKTINELLGPDVASAMDAGSVRVTAPRDMNQRVTYMSVLENLEVTVGEAPARVIINSRTGTIVVGQHVRVSPVAVTHGSLTVTVAESAQVSQPNPFAGGQTAVVPQSQVDVAEGTNPMFVFDAGTTLNEIVKAVNQVGAAPGDMMAILEALKQAGALKADLVVI
jgi:flagellar P-ring protein precursor FlgI